MILRPDHSELDRALLAAREPGDVIQLRSGVYPTRGNWQFPDYRSIAPGVRLIGEGVDETIIQLRPDAVRAAAGVTRPDRDLHVLWGGSQCAIADLTIDGNEMAFRGPNPAEDWFVAGVRFHGAFALRRVAIRRLRGAWSPAGSITAAIEVFAVSSQGDTGGTLIEDVVVGDMPQESYVSGIYLGATVPARVLSHVNRCTVELGGGNQFAFAANSHVSFRDCDGNGGKYGFYNDTGSTEDIRIAGCRLDGSWSAISVIAKDCDSRRTQIRVTDSALRGPRGVEIWDRTGNGVRADVLVRECDIDAEIVAAVANPPPCAVRVERCRLRPFAKSFSAPGSAGAGYTANRFDDGTRAPDRLPEYQPQLA